MKTKLSVLICLISILSYSQGPSYSIENNASFNTNALNDIEVIGSNGFEFDLLDAGINSKYSEFTSGFFRNKLIMVSSKKIGGFAKIDPNTNEAYKDIYCLDINNNGHLSSPLLFSRILNTKYSEGQLAFSPDQKTVYYTRSTKDNSLEYKLYKATLEEGSHGNWVNEELLDVNGYDTSIEHPFMSPAGDKLYFSSNMADAIGGYDIYVSDINADGTLGIPSNLGNHINTKEDDKYPALSKDGKYLYFSSKGHQNMGGYDLFVSRILSDTYKKPRNLGNTINTAYDEVSYYLAANNKGYVSSNRPGGKGGFDIYTAINEEVSQVIEGKVLDLETKIKLPNTLVILKDEEGNEISRLITKEDASYSFDVVPFDVYTISTEKDGFKNADFKFLADKTYNTSYNKDLELNTTAHVIAKVKEELRIVIENIYFDFDKHSIKEESQISLNKIVKVFTEHSEMKLSINAHTDNKGKDAYNLNLSDKRAASAMKYLIANGIAKERLQSKGFGETIPLINCENNCSDEDLQSNRRVEFVILD